MHLDPCSRWSSTASGMLSQDQLAHAVAAFASLASSGPLDSSALAGRARFYFEVHRGRKVALSPRVKAFIQTQGGFDRGSEQLYTMQVALETFTDVVASGTGKTKPPAADHEAKCMWVDALAKQRIMDTTKGRGAVLAWVPSAYSETVELLENADAGLIGSGQSGSVHFGRVLMGDGSVEACAVKSLQYGSPEERGHAHSELQALRMARGVPHVVQGLAAFPYRCLDNNQDVLMLAMRYVDGMDLHDAINCLKLKLDQRGASQREASDALLAAGQLVAQHVLLALQELHKQGQAVCDIKLANVRVQVASDGTFLTCTLLDLGGSVRYEGEYGKRPEPMQFNSLFCSPEVIFGAFGSPEKHISMCPHDIWAVGALFLFIITQQQIFAPEHLTSAGDIDWEQCNDMHNKWAELHCVYGNSSPMSASYEMLSSQAELHCVRCSRNPFSISDGLLLRLQAELHGVHSNSNLSHCNDPSLAELSSRLTKEQLPVVCNCLQRMLHPDLTKRAEVGEALELMAQLSATLPQLIPLPNQADPT